MGLKIRWVEKFLIESDKTVYRYDTLWILPDGTEKQYHVEMPQRDDALAMQVLESQMRSYGAVPSQRQLDLPTNVRCGRFWAADEW